MLHEALAQLPWQPASRVGRKVLVRTDSGGGTHEFVQYCHARRVQYSLGFTLTDTIVEAVNKVPKKVWTPAYNAEGKVREGAWVAEIERREALFNRVEVEDLHHAAVAAVG
ncbi:MAG: transposase [Mycobacterium sp.]|nr:transposase [Mycobacterium sp.]